MVFVFMVSYINRNSKCSLNGRRLIYKELEYIMKDSSWWFITRVGSQEDQEHCMKSTVACATVDYDMMP